MVLEVRVALDGSKVTVGLEVTVGLGRSGGDSGSRWVWRRQWV